MTYIGVQGDTSVYVLVKNPETVRESIRDHEILTCTRDTTVDQIADPRDPALHLWMRDHSSRR